jgi:hypothetical protein
MVIPPLKICKMALQRTPHRAKARPTRTLNNPIGLLGFCAAVVER